MIKGKVFDVAVDLRQDSPTFGKWEGCILSYENKRQFFIPRGFAHGFLVLSDEAEFCYKCDDVYHPDDEGGIRWDDKNVGIKWPIPDGEQTLDISRLILSTKDRDSGSLSEITPFALT